jgi:hypothetical protein
VSVVLAEHVHSSCCFVVALCDRSNRAFRAAVELRCSMVVLRWKAPLAVVEDGG